jgi:hypothetical protein
LKATGYFSKNSQIGEGGGSLVYKGGFTDGTDVAIKRAKKVHHNSLNIFLVLFNMID